MRTAPNPLIDTLKALASQLIVLHHLAFYGPMSDHAYAPDLIDWLYDYARMAVQCFLVIGGYLAAQSLAPSGHITKPKFTLPGLLWKRYLRLALPLFAALGLAIAAAALVRTIHPLPDTPTAPALGQLVAHLLLAQQILGHESLSAGVWYVAIDFQLFALFAALMWLGRHAGRFANFAPLLVLSLTLASLYGFNRQPELDIWAPYFFGAYGLGITV
ncbi:MAG: hypothetical protein BSR46_17075 [Candidatus Dactylopiibacterium carminicum]|nr:MAG: hypothetical protein BSR46_17075 [Candidatus Dactylopiibacterium carminicum]